jgi:Fe2+ or Zn2+ uptake regulation protein
MGGRGRALPTAIIISYCKLFALVYSGDVEDFKNLLHTRGFRATPGRLMLLRTLWSAKRPLTVDEVGRRLNLNVVTLYRALSDLADAGLLLRGSGTGDAMHFSYPRNHHHHMICADCGFIRECQTC